MIRKKLVSVVCGIFIWILGVSFYLLSFHVPMLKNPELQSNVVLALSIVPCACLGTYVFYMKRYIKPSALAFVFVIVAMLLDAIITVPVFIIPNGGSHLEFFGDPMFYFVLVVYYCTVYYFGNLVINKKINA